MNNKMLGAVALLGAPAMALGIWMEERYAEGLPSWWQGAWGVLYLTGFMASMLAFRRMEVAGENRLGGLLPRLMLVTLTIGNLSNLWLMIAPEKRTTFYFVLDAGWPLSHVLMLVFGILVAKAGVLRGWKRYVPLFCGGWLPLAMATKIADASALSFVFGSVYNALAWSLLALVVLTSASSQNSFAVKAFH
ncbi:hypothetical protein [Tellurirhabdus rosea]|uniref:hypothetical protein n=1 Tax=Tellurirhabdus rosea TaxID=2674997 RepID=UPI00224CBC7F|nr:hypothetical protein [Tellurirhabdus rosea]